MNDKELLELAAKAAGYQITPHPNYKLSRQLIFIHAGSNWNPIISDGDALRLAVKLKVEVLPEVYGLRRCDTRNRHGEYYTEHATTGQSMNAATRRAIVRAAAAAEIGKETP